MRHELEELGNRPVRDRSVTAARDAKPRVEAGAGESRHKLVDLLVGVVALGCEDSHWFNGGSD